jgi:hypothetical protein
VNPRTVVNAMRRDHANQIAEQAAKLLGIAAPKCDRISRRRGFGRFGRFSVPSWAFEAHPLYREYYIAHEVCHSVPGANKHGPAFRVNEQRVCESLGMRLVFSSGGAYPDGIKDLATGEVVCSRRGIPV